MPADPPTSRDNAPPPPSDRLVPGIMMPDGLNIPSRRNGVEHLTRHHGSLRDRLGVDDGRLAGDGDGFLDRADLQLSVDRGGEIGGQFDPLPPDRAEAGQCKRHDVRAGTKILHSVDPGGICHASARLFDEHRARGLDGHTGQNSPGIVFDRPGDAARLSHRRRGYDQGNQDHSDSRSERTLHAPLLFRCSPAAYRPTVRSGRIAPRMQNAKCGRIFEPGTPTGR